MPRPRVRSLLPFLLAALLLLPSPLVFGQQDTLCPPGQAPAFVFGFADLKGHIGEAMGEPLTCEFPDPNGTGDVHQLTTTGLAFWRKSTNMPTFTNGWEHWGRTEQGWVYWTGSSIDPPPSTTQSSASALWTTEVYTPLATYPNAVRVPPEGLLPFSDYPITKVAWPVGDALTGMTGYLVTFGTPVVMVAHPDGYTISEPGDGATVDGYAGQVLYEFARTPYFWSCPDQANYCPSGGPGSTTPTGEIFRDLRVLDALATVAHAEDAWSVVWYDSNSNMTFRISLIGAAAGAFPGALGEDNRPHAEALARLAEQLVELP